MWSRADQLVLAGLAGRCGWRAVSALWAGFAGDLSRIKGPQLVRQGHPALECSRQGERAALRETWLDPAGIPPDPARRGVAGFQGPAGVDRQEARGLSRETAARTGCPSRLSTRAAQVPHLTRTRVSALFEWGSRQGCRDSREKGGKMRRFLTVPLVVVLAGFPEVRRKRAGNRPAGRQSGKSVRVRRAHVADPTRCPLRRKLMNVKILQVAVLL